MFYDAHIYYRSAGANSDLLNFWGNQFLELLLCLVVVYLAVELLFNVINHRITGEKKPAFRDERDDAIELKVVHASFYTLALGVFLAVLLGIWVQTISPGLMIIMGSFLVSGLVGEVLMFGGSNILIVVDMVLAGGCRVSRFRAAVGLHPPPIGVVL